MYLLQYNIYNYSSYMFRQKVVTKTATNHTPPQQRIDINSDFVMHKGIPIAIVRIRHEIL